MSVDAMLALQPCWPRRALTPHPAVVDATVSAALMPAAPHSLHSSIVSAPVAAAPPQRRRAA